MIQENKSGGLAAREQWWAAPVLLVVLPRTGSVRDGSTGTKFSIEALKGRIRTRAVKLTEAGLMRSRRLASVPD